MKLYFKKTILDKVDLDLDKLSKILIKRNIDSMIDEFTSNIDDYLSTICSNSEIEDILECEENIPRLEGKLRSCLLSICNYESTSNQKS